MTFQLYKEVALGKDLPQYGFCKGDIGTIVEYYPATKNQEAGYSLEMLNANGEVLKVITVEESSLRQLSSSSVLSVRELAPTG